MNRYWGWMALALLAVGCGDSRPSNGMMDAGTMDDTYTVCNTSADCADGDECWLVQLAPAGTSGQFCSYTCASDLDCESSLGFSGV